ncbi:hypothetical protein BOTBODRAFT_118813, partial [Botryobasidium botryosum FD-172 SS1]
MDESGFPPADTGTQRVVGARGTKTQHRQGGGDHENVTALVTICADGTALRPMIIYKGKNFIIAHSPNGWTDSELAIDWIINDFDPQTREKAGGRTRVLLLDGHSSHYSTQLLDFAAANNIIILGYPPHCTHALQGLDVVCFAKMKDAWKEDIHKFEETHRRSVTKGDFTKVFGTAFLRAFMRESILAAFKATGIHPFNPDIIKPTQTKPSEATSVKGGFPLQHAPPVMA